MRIRVWNTLRYASWPFYARTIAGLILFDQWLGPFGSIPSDTAIVVVALGALFAPVPSRHKGDD